MYLGSSGHQNLKKELPERSPSQGLRKASKVGICTSENVPRSFRQPKPKAKKNMQIALWRAPPLPYLANPIPAMPTQLFLCTDDVLAQL